MIGALLNVNGAERMVHIMTTNEKLLQHKINCVMFLVVLLFLYAIYQAGKQERQQRASSLKLGAIFYKVGNQPPIEFYLPKTTCNDLGRASGIARKPFGYKLPLYSPASASLPGFDYHAVEWEKVSKGIPVKNRN